MALAFRVGNMTLMWRSLTENCADIVSIDGTGEVCMLGLTHEYVRVSDGTCSVDWRSAAQALVHTMAAEKR